MCTGPCMKSRPSIELERVERHHGHRRDDIHHHGDHFIIVVSLEERGSGAFYRSPISRACLRARFTSCWVSSRPSSFSRYWISFRSSGVRSAKGFRLVGSLLRFVLMAH